MRGRQDCLANLITTAAFTESSHRWLPPLVIFDDRHFGTSTPLSHPISLIVAPS